MSESNNFYSLDPNLILEVAEKNGYSPTGELIQLNSYENRVFDVRLNLNEGTPLHALQDRGSLIAKFYRPNRWTRETILDEHHFIAELRSNDIEVAPTLKLNTSFDSIGETHGMYFSFFEKVRGRLVQELTEAHLLKLGRWLARLHNVGCQKKSLHRATLGPTNDNKWDILDKLLERVSPEVVGRYEEAAITIFEKLDEELLNHNFIRTHGDLHRGNILENSTGDFIVIDFDDMINGPEMQDFWMLLPSAEAEGPEFEALVKGYSDLRRFPEEQLNLVPLLRGYRIITYAMWIMNRWSDPSFKKVFSEFGEYSYWAEETESLERISYKI